MPYRVTDQKRYDVVKSQLEIIEKQIKKLESLRSKFWKEAQSLVEEYFDQSSHTPEYISLVDKFIKDQGGKIPKQFEYDRHFYFCSVNGWNIEGIGEYSVYYRDVELRIKDNAKN